jgi:hypothetical protein
VTSSYLLLSPVKDAATGVAGNPLLELGNGVAATADVLSVSLTDGRTVSSYTEHEPHLTYTVTRDQSLAAPVVVISVSDISLQVAEATLDSLGSQLSERLVTLQQQADAPSAQWVTVRDLTHDPKPDLGFSTAVRNAVLVFLGVIVILLVCLAVADRSRARRRGDRERPDRDDAADAESDADAPAAPTEDDPAEQAATPSTSVLASTKANPRRRPALRAGIAGKNAQPATERDPAPRASGA